MPDFKKGILISTFVKRKNILSFLEYVRNTFGISYFNIFVFEIEDNNDEYLTSFKVSEPIQFNGMLSKSNVVHRKNGCIFSINALNKLIEISKTDSTENSEYEINWNNYKNKLMLTDKNELTISNITKIDDFCVFFS